MLTPENLPRHVREALAHFFDPAFLQTSPLVALLREGEEGAVSVRLQGLLREGIELLRPDSSIPPERPEWYGYRILQYRYLQLRHMQTVCDELALSTASLYRYQQQAIEALAAILWKPSHQGIAPAEPPASLAPTPDEQAVQEAVRLARAARQEPVDFLSLLDNVRQTFAPLAQRRGISVTFGAPATLPTIYGDRAVLHQAIVNLLAGVLDTGWTQVLRLEVSVQGREIIGRLADLPEDKVMALDLLARAEFTLSRELLAVCGGRLEIERQGAGRAALYFALPGEHRPAILIIEDHEDTIQLYRRYLQKQGHRLRVAHSGDEAWQLLTEESLPALIILDVLMPREDGWMILQRLKVLPETAHLPVIIYSVLSQPSLALALGAVAVLRKPVEEDTLLRAVERVLG